MHARDQLIGYLAQKGEIVGNVGYPDLPRLSALVRMYLPRRIGERVRQLGTASIRPYARTLAAKALTGSPLRLHLGSGRFHKDGWVNVDLLGAPVDLPWNLARGVPFPDGSADVVFHEHLLEHLTLDQGHRFMNECFRVLKPGGVLRAGVPDAGEYLRSYAGDGQFVESVRPGRPTTLLAVQELFYLHGHRTMFDFDTLAFLCRAAGFSVVERRRFGEGRLMPNPDGEHRRRETLYVECVKP